MGQDGASLPCPGSSVVADDPLHHLITKPSQCMPQASDYQDSLSIHIDPSSVVLVYEKQLCYIRSCCSCE
jgi:hypothetical protein